MKGSKRLLKIFAQYIKENPKAKLQIAGSGWTSKIIPATLKENIILLGNIDNIYDYYANSSALLFTSYTEGYPNVLVEAIVSGLPVIAFEAGDSKQILKSYPYGVTLDSNRTFLEKMHFFSKHPFTVEERLKELLIQKEKFNFKKTVAEYKRFLKV